MSISRRDFLTSTVIGSLSVSLEAQQHSSVTAIATPKTAGKRPVIISAKNGFDYLDEAFHMLTAGADTLDAALRVARGPEDDPNNDSVGLGGIPNEEGVVELDASCMHGPTRRAGAVGGMRNIKNSSLVAKAVMEHTGHIMLVGEGAERFAVAQGFPHENLLTERSRKIWMLWKEWHSTRDWWGPGIDAPNWTAPDTSPDSQLWPERLRKLEQMAANLAIEPEFRHAAIRRVLFPPTGTIHCSALNEKGEISGCTTTSGLAFKLPGRVGDSALIGAGCYTDQDVGSAGATGTGEQNIKVAGAHTIVENMRRGMSPQEAGLDTLKRIVRNFNGDHNKLRFMDMTYYALRADGAYGCVSLWEGYSPTDQHGMAIHDGTRRIEKSVALLKGNSQRFPPVPKIPPELLEGSDYYK